MSTYLEIYETTWGRRIKRITRLASISLYKIGGRLFTSIPALGYIAPNYTPLAPVVPETPVPPIATETPPVETLPVETLPAETPPVEAVPTV
jgi:hypothetical protein